jgi:hypothetical protein
MFNAVLTFAVHRSIHRILNALTSEEVYRMYVRLPPNNFSFPESLPPEQNKAQFVPFFNQCLGALDGTHVPAYVPEVLRAAYRNWKGDISQNVLAACSFDMRILYVLSGWEGSASDSRVFEDARTSDFWIPPERYYLGDAGYANSDVVLAPYRGVRYHLKEWGTNNLRYVIISFRVRSNVYFLDLKIIKNYSIIATQSSVM